MTDFRGHRRLSVLVGDDDVAVRSGVCEILADRGFRIHTADRGSTALGILLTSPIDVLILDVEMPDFTGIEVVRRYLRGPWVTGSGVLPARRRRRAVPTIFMSASRSPEVRSAAEAMGTTFLDKPFAATDMRAAVDRILARPLIDDPARPGHQSPHLS